MDNPGLNVESSPKMAVMPPDKAGADSPGGETIEELFTALESPLLGYAFRYTGEMGLAEDIVQEAFMKLHAQFEQVQMPRRWLYRTVRNLALNRRRDGSKPSRSAALPTMKVPPPPKPPTRPLPDEQIIRLEGIGLVRISLEALDDRGRELIRLKFNDELSYKDIAARTGLTTGNVGFLLHQALKTIAVELARTGVVP